MIAAIVKNDEPINNTNVEPTEAGLAKLRPWLHGRVPAGYWDQLEHRKGYLLWLGQRCGFAKPEDWYQVRQSHFKKNYGGGLLANVYGFSVQKAVGELYPEHELLPWMFGGVPQRFWKDAVNRRSYMRWLGAQLGYDSPSDWYRLTKSKFYKNSGGGLLANYYGDSPQRALAEFMPNVEWIPWSFSSVPQSYWKLRENRVRFMNWLGEKVGISNGDWSTIRASDFQKNGGGGLLVYHYDGSVLAAVRDFLRDYEWDHSAEPKATETTEAACG